MAGGATRLSIAPRDLCGANWAERRWIVEDSGKRREEKSRSDAVVPGEYAGGGGKRIPRRSSAPGCFAGVVLLSCNRPKP